MAGRRRRSAKRRPPDEQSAVSLDQHVEQLDLPEGSEHQQQPEVPGGSGPYDVTELADDGVRRVDLGGLRVPVPAGTEVRVDVADDQVVAANVVFPDSTLQLQAFAAPRSRGIWEEVRTELAAGISQSGGTVDEVPGPYGVELRANVPVRRPDGRNAHEPARFLGYDGPRWFLRGVITGAAVGDATRAATLEDAFGHVVVVRGDSPKPPREPLEMSLPREHAEIGTEPAESDPIQPFRRGPEITETR